MKRRKKGVFKKALLLFFVTVLLGVVLEPAFFLELIRTFWRTTTVILGVFSIELAMVYLRKVVGLAPELVLLIGLVWVNVSWMWWTFLFTVASFAGKHLYQSRSRQWLIRFLRMHLKRLVRFASAKSQSRHFLIRFLRTLVENCRGSRWRLAALFFVAGIAPHVDVAAIFVAITYGFSLMTDVWRWRMPVFRFPYILLWTVSAMNLKIILLGISLW